MLSRKNRSILLRTKLRFPDQYQKIVQWIIAQLPGPKCAAIRDFLKNLLILSGLPTLVGIARPIERFDGKCKSLRCADRPRSCQLEIELFVQVAGERQMAHHTLGFADDSARNRSALLASPTRKARPRELGRAAENNLTKKLVVVKLGRRPRS